MSLFSDGGAWAKITGRVRVAWTKSNSIFFKLSPTSHVIFDLRYPKKCIFFIPDVDKYCGKLKLLTIDVELWPGSCSQTEKNIAVHDYKYLLDGGLNLCNYPIMNK